jgi:hypothetical protein
MSELVHDNRVLKAIARLKAMGLEVSLYTPNPDEVLLFITLPSLAQLIERRIEYPKREVGLADDMMVIHFWRGENPIYQVKQLLSKK